MIHFGVEHERYIQFLTGLERECEQYFLTK